jgi:hypothetical protein
MSIKPNSSRRIARETLRIAPSSDRPDWVPATERLPAIGEQVFCTEGMAEVARLLGKTSDGSRLLELVLPERGPRQPFFAAASNVLVAPG